MCTLAVSLGVDRRWPVVVAANRDERLGRPAEGWALRTTPGGVPWVGPRDAQAGGTWIGLSSRGVLAALTNFHAPHAWYPDPARRSRGELVPRALEAPSASAARQSLAPLDPAAWNPFHLVVADTESAFLWWFDGEAAGVEPLGAGLHVVTEGSPHGLGPRGDLVRSRWPLDPAPARLRELLALHAPPHPAPTGLHVEPTYGTRSSAVVRLPRELRHAELYAADGPPCTFPLEDRSALLAGLAGRATSA
jgi:uncharacterized protein with NRDE domain